MKKRRAVTERALFAGHSMREKTLVDFKLPTKRATDTVYREVKNVLPMLARHYGPLKLASDTKSR